eukprot:gene7452-8274_t
MSLPKRGKQPYNFFNDCRDYIQNGKCKKQTKGCKFRHCEDALKSQVLCINWLDKKCFDKQCPDRHCTPSTLQVKKQDGAVKRKEKPSEEKRTTNRKPSSAKGKSDVNKKNLILEGLPPDWDISCTKSFCLAVLKVELRFQIPQHDNKAVLVGMKYPIDYCEFDVFQIIKEWISLDIAELEKRLKDNSDQCPPNNENIKLKAVKFCKRVMITNIPIIATEEQILALFKENDVNAISTSLKVINGTKKCAIVELASTHVDVHNMFISQAQFLMEESEQDASKCLLEERKEQQQTSTNLKKESSATSCCASSSEHPMAESLFLLFHHKGLIEKVERGFNVQISHDNGTSMAAIIGETESCEDAKYCLMCLEQCLKKQFISVGANIQKLMYLESGKKLIAKLLIFNEVYVYVLDKVPSNGLFLKYINESDVQLASHILQQHLNDEYSVHLYKLLVERELEEGRVGRSCNSIKPLVLETLTPGADMVAFLVRFGGSVVESIENNWKRSLVKIIISEADEIITIHGEKVGVNEAKCRLSKTIRDIEVEDLLLQQPGVVKLFAKDIAKSFKAGVEKEFSVMIFEAVKKKVTHPIVKTQPALKHVDGSLNDIKVQLVIGNLEDERSDVIVNSTASNLDLNSNASSKALSKAAGPQLQQECNRKVGLSSRLNRALARGKIIETPGYQLNCKVIFHVHVGNNLSNVKVIVTNVLIEASAMGYQSISLPAIGTGRCGFDPFTVAQMINGAITDFKTTPAFQTTVKQVNVVAFSQDVTTITAFKKVFKPEDPGQSLMLSSDSASSTRRRSTIGDKQYDNLQLLVYSFSKANITTAIERIKTFVSDYISETTIQPSIPIVKNQLLLMKIRKFASDCNVDTNVDDKGTIKLNGDPKDIIKVQKFCTEEFEKVSKRTTSDSLTDQLPHTWTPMTSGESHKLVAVSEDTREHRSVVKRFRDSCRGGVSKIVSVHRIQNPQLYHAFMLKKKSMDKRGGSGSNEMQLFHGTTKDTCDEINHHGFNRSFAGKNATAYGKGSYFALNSSYALRYAQPEVERVVATGFRGIANWLTSTSSTTSHRYVYAARVLVGEYTTGSSEMKTPPKKHTGSTEMFDSTTDSSMSPTIFVIYHDNQTYPEYLICFE